MGRGWLGLTIAIACATGVAVCDDGGPPKRGFGSRQLLALRDPTFLFQGTWAHYALFATRGGGAGGSLQTFAVDVETGDIRSYTEFADLPLLPPDPSPPPGRYSCSYGVSTVPRGTLFIITDTQSGVETGIDGAYVFMPPCPTEASTTITLWRIDGAGGIALWTGPFDELAKVSLEPNLTIQSVFTFGNGLSHVIASQPEAPGMWGVYEIELADFSVEERVPPRANGAAWAAGAFDGGALESETLSDKMFIRYRLHDTFVYQRRMTDGREVLFAGPFPEGPRELALMEVRPTTFLEPVAQTPSDGVYAVDRIVRPAFRTSDTVEGGESLVVWDHVRRRMVRCPFSGPPRISGMRTPDGEHLLFEPQQFDSTGDTGAGVVGSALLITLAAATDADASAACNTLAADDAAGARFSPDGNALFWLVSPPDRLDSELWIAASDGGNRRLIGTGHIPSIPVGPHFTGPSQLELKLESDLAWLDVHDDPVRMHYLAERVFGDAIDVDHWLVTGYTRNRQDGSGLLGVVNRDDGGKRPISSDVVDYVSPDYPNAPRYAPFARGEVGAVRVVYLVRGRNPSPQDGIWMATVNPGDIP